MRGKISLAILATLVCGAVIGQDLVKAPSRQVVVPYRTDVEAPTAVFASNLFVEPCNTCNYDSNAGGFYLWGPNNCTQPGTAKSIAVPFVSKITGVPRRIMASINLTDATLCSANEVNLTIYTDLCFPTGPGTALASGRAVIPPAPCALATATLRNAPSLTAGTKYWVVADPLQATVDAIWYASNNAQIAENVNFGGWFQFTGGTPGFMVTN